MGLALYRFQDESISSFSSSFLSSLEEGGDTDLDSDCPHYSVDSYHARKRSRRSIHSSFNSSFSDDDDSSQQWSQDSTSSRDGRISTLPEGVESQERRRRPPSLERQDAFWDGRTVKRRCNKRGIEEMESHHRAAKRIRRNTANTNINDNEDNNTRRKTWNFEMEQPEEHKAIIWMNGRIIEEAINWGMIDDDNNTPKDQVKHLSGVVP
ncbi:hypothetical protein QBC44DRAFT_318755 [Cladorrhinum sp. PSN332]|nr:hypothetical protein QBC44DRAFT_318755 [Cladorrhinum sp. PSN332]